MPESGGLRGLGKGALYKGIAGAEADTPVAQPEPTARLMLTQKGPMTGARYKTG